MPEPLLYLILAVLFLLIIGVPSCLFCSGMYVMTGSKAAAYIFFFLVLLLMTMIALVGYDRLIRVQRKNPAELYSTQPGYQRISHTYPKWDIRRTLPLVT